jgi:Tfp pilus assembly protein PilF
VEIVLLPKTASEDHQLGRFFVTEDGHKLAVTFLNTAVSAANRGDLDLALELAQKSCEMDREQAYPLAVLGWIHMARKEDQAAASAFARANGREPRNEFFKRSLDLVNPYLSKKVGRNDPCPCGSGKKFKKCHGGV